MKLTHEQTQLNYVGDLRILRHEIVHNGAILREPKCRNLKLIDWLEPGQEIAMTAAERVKLDDLLPWSDLVELVGGGPVF